MPRPELPSALDGTVVVIGAGGGGIGTAIAQHAAAAGARVVAVDRDAERLALGMEAIEGGSGEGRVCGELCDASDAAAVDALFRRLAGEGSDLRGLVNVVGGLPAARWRRLLEDDDENLDALLESNLRIAVRSSRAFARHCIEARRPASIVQIATIAALEGMPYGAGYAASKAALLSYTRTMALEWGSCGLRVNAIAPGSVVVPKNREQSAPDRDGRVIPLGRRGTPEDVAHAALFLLSDGASWITGQVLAVDGGASIKPSYLDDEGFPVFVRDEALRRRVAGD